MKKNYEELAVLYTEKYGIVEYELKGSLLKYENTYYDGSQWLKATHTVQLNHKPIN